MADATQAAKARLDRALAELERKVSARVAAPASSRISLPDDDLFAMTPHDPRADDRECSPAGGVTAARPGR